MPAANLYFIAPQPGQTFLLASGNTVQATATGLVTLPTPVTPNDVANLTNAGCFALGPSNQNLYLRKIGTFTANGITAVTVADTSIAATDFIDISLSVVGGTPGGAPYVSALTAGTSWQSKSVAGDTSTYNYQVWSAGPT